MGAFLREVLGRDVARLLEGVQAIPLLAVVLYNTFRVVRRDVPAFRAMRPLQ